MVTTSLDYITRNILLKRNYPIHYYLQFLLFCREALSEISMDDLQVINYINLPVNSYNACNLPNDFLDEVNVLLPIGQKLRPLVKDTSITPLNNFDSNFNIITYQAAAAQSPASLIYNNVFLSAIFNSTSFNSYGEPVGKFFGIGAASPADTYNIIKSRNQIQLNESLVTSNVVLEYLGNGTSANAITQITPYAERTIDAYAMWKFKENNRTYSAGEAGQAEQLYIKERLILRARMSDITINGIRRIIQRNSTGSIHN